MSVQASALNLNPPLTATGTWRSRVLAVVLMVTIAGVALCLFFAMRRAVFRMRLLLAYLSQSSF